MRAAALALGSVLAACGIGGATFAAPPWCPDLARVADLAATDKLAYIAGPPREGSFRDTTMPLAGWRDCSLYGARTYTCDTQAFTANEQAETALAALVTEVKECLGDAWRKDDSRSSPGYVVLRNDGDAVSMTLSTDTLGDREHVVHLTIFRRGR